MTAKSTKLHGTPCSTSRTVTLVKKFQICSFDMRNNTKHWMASDLGEQASFYVNRTGRFTDLGVEIVESYLQIKSVQWKDQGFYRCRVDFFQAPTRNLKVRLSLRGN